MAEPGFFRSIVVRVAIGLAAAVPLIGGGFAVTHALRSRGVPRTTHPDISEVLPVAPVIAASPLAASLVSPLVFPPPHVEYTPPPPQANYPDLSIAIIDTGVLVDGLFDHARTINRGEEPAVVFEVANVGAAVSSRWQFTANLPLADGDFISAIQRPLAPGERLRYTINFLELAQGGDNTVTLALFPWHDNGDGNPENNVASVLMRRGY